MQCFIITIAFLSLALGMRLGKGRIAKKLGALCFVIAMGYLGYSLTNHWCGAVIIGGLWFFIPLIEILFKHRNEKYPLSPPALCPLDEIDETFFPHASRYKAQLEDLGFDEVGNHSWKWMDTNQHHRFFWHPELHTIASVCLCELEKIAFSYVILYSELSDEHTLRTTNYPFTSPLAHPPKTHWKHVPCEEKYIPHIFSAHKKLIKKHNSKPCKLRIPDPETVGQTWVENFHHIAEHNLSCKLIRKEGKQFSYTTLGYLRLWLHAVKDLIRLC